MIRSHFGGGHFCMTSPAIDIPGYQLVKELGAGGMATVFLAIQSSLERRVAIKVMRRGLADENTEKRFLLEGRTMARLPHPNIVGVYDIVQNETINYIAMECLDGGTLSDRLRDGLTLAEAISIVVQVAGALQFAHDNGIVHRDLKPANIMFRDQHTPVLTDFGIARQQDPAATRLTQTGMMIGTPTYMSPEQATGGEIDGRSDQYSLGVLFFEMLTGHPPFEGETPIQVVLAHLNTPPPSLPVQFAFFQPLMDRLLAKDRDARYPDLRTFSRELKTLLASSDSLMHRLQIDPNQTASERLRGLGFSESQINTGAARISGAAPAVTGQRQGPRSGGPGVRMGPEPGSRPRWLWPAVGAGVLSLAIGGWLLFGGSGDRIDPALKKILDTQLVAVDQLIEQNRLVAPEGNNAYEQLQNILQAAPGYGEAQARIERIVARLREQADKALAARSFATAETRISEALAVAPQDAEVLALQKKIELARLAAEREARIAGLLEQAATSRQAGRLFGDGGDSALAALRQAQEIDPGHAAARQALDELTALILQPVTQALSAGKLDDAERLLDARGSHLAGEPAWQALQQQLTDARERLAQQQRIDALLAAARRQLQAGRIAEPAGDNVLESLVRIGELDSGNAAAARLARDAGQALVRQAQQADRAGDPSLAYSLYEQALRAVPQQAEWLAAKQTIEQRLGEQQRQFTSALADAQAAIRERRYYAPAGNNAREALDRALALNPADATAKRLVSELPSYARDAATALAREGRHDDALALLAEVGKRDRGDAETTRLIARISAERDQAQAAAQRDQRLAALRELLARRQLNADIARRIAAGIAALQKADLDDADALQIRDTFLQGVRHAFDAVQDSEQLAAIDAVLKEVESALGARSPDVAALRRDYAQRADRLQAEERQRLAALAGTLLLDAHPWANVESIVEQGSKQALELPKDRSTPLRLSAPPGTYRVTFRHPDVAQPVVRVISLQPRGDARTSANFPTMDAREYLRRAGYAP